MNKEKILIQIIIVVVILSYVPIFNGFFQQDEWLAFAYHSEILSKGPIGYLSEIFSPSVGHYQPLNTFVISLLFQLLKLDYIAYSILSIALHLVVVLLVFYLAKILFKNLNLAFFTALLFGVSASIYQGTTWIMANLSVQISTILGLLSIIFFLFYLEKLKRKFFIYSLVTLAISLLFKEITLGLFIILPLLVLLFKKKKIRDYKKDIALIILIGLLFLIIRVGMFLIPSSYQRGVAFSESQAVNTLLYNLVTYPIKTLPQALIPVEILIDLSYSASDLLPTEVAGELNTTKRDIIAQKWILEILSISLFTLSTIILISYLKRYPKNKFVKIALFGFILVIFSSPFFAFAPEKSGKVTIVDSRNLYFINIGAVIFFISLANLIIKGNKTYFLLLMTFIVIVNIYLLRDNIHRINEYANLRKKILSKVDEENPSIKMKTIFFIKSDKSYFGLPDNEKILPFQSGFGQTLIVWYYNKGEMPTEYLKDKYLWEITSQGYKQVGDYGFGYFRNLEELKKAVKQYNIPKESVIGYEWNSNNETLINASEEVKGKL